ncbi:hypothetical protein FACS1894122_04160 [Alphaproteobacteria bacterium]|nr:hypothetical protein FACS1894122_04160 [Alphaproteobacteria bacterium]
MVAPRALINSAFTSKIVQKYHSKEDSKVENESSVTLGWTLVALICVAAVFLITYPKFFHGMEGDISEYVKLIWLSKVHEMMPVLASEFGIDFMIYALVTLIAATNKIHSLIDKRLCRSSIIWLIFILNAIFYTILTFFSVRMLQFSVLFGLPMLVDLGMNSKLTESFSRISRVILTFSLTIGVYFTSSVMLDPFTASVTLTLDSFTLDSTSHPYKAIDDLSDIPVVIMASSNDGPKLLYYTKHSVVGAPYHRQQEGIISSHKVMHDVFSEKTVGKILLDTNSSYIFIKRSNYTHKKAGGKTSLAGMIVHNINVPPWITIVKLPKKFDDITIAKVNKKMLMERLK